MHLLNVSFLENATYHRVDVVCSEVVDQLRLGRLVVRRRVADDEDRWRLDEIQIRELRAGAGRARALAIRGGAALDGEDAVLVAAFPALLERHRHQLAVAAGRLHALLSALNRTGPPVADGTLSVRISFASEVSLICITSDFCYIYMLDLTQKCCDFVCNDGVSNSCRK